MEFIKDVNGDPDFSDPMLVSEEEWENNLLQTPEEPENDVLGVYRDGDLTGVFVFLIAEEDRNIEMLVGLSRSAEAYAEMTDYLQVTYPGYQVDFVYNPRNRLLSELLERKGARFETEQQKMVFSGKMPEVNTEGVEALSDRTQAQYLAIHDDEDRYWTGEKVVKAPDRFNVFVAVENGAVVGYIDVSNCFE